MAIVIHKILSKSTGEQSDEPNFWFEKSSYGRFIVDCRFGDDILKTSTISSVSIFVLDQAGTDVTASILSTYSIVEAKDSVLVTLEHGVVSGSPYDVYCRVTTDAFEKSELAFQMRISRNSISEAVTFGGDTVTFDGDSDISF